MVGAVAREQGREVLRLGVETSGDYHGGYLNSGLWEDGNTDHLVAAENMVRHVGRLAGLDERSRLLDAGPGMGAQDLLPLKTFNPQSIDALDVTWPHIVIALQRARIILPPAHHGEHHSAPFESSYSITNGWLNPLLNRTCFFRRLEGLLRALGVRPSRDA